METGRGSRDTPIMTRASARIYPTKADTIIVTTSRTLTPNVPIMANFAGLTHGVILPILLPCKIFAYR
jgi:hypothetical protein